MFLESYIIFVVYLSSARHALFVRGTDIIIFFVETTIFENYFTVSPCDSRVDDFSTKVSTPGIRGSTI